MKIKIFAISFYVLSLLVLSGCEQSSTSSTACQSAFDANGNPTTNCVGDT